MKQKPRIGKATNDGIRLPQEIIESFARFLVPEIRAFYKSEEGQQAFKEWVEKNEEQNKKSGANSSRQDGISAEDDDVTFG